MTMNTRPLLRTIVAPVVTAGLALAGTAALAHTGVDAHVHPTDALARFTTGFVHPFSGLDHLAAMLAVGVWSAVRLPASLASFSPARAGLHAGSRGGQAWRLAAAPLSFALMLMLGAVLAAQGLALPAVEPMIAASLLVLGLLVSTRAPLPTWLGTALVGGFALFHGAAHGSELAGAGAPALAGMVLATAALHGLGLLAGLRVRDTAQPSHRWATRAAGLGVTALGAVLMTPALASAL